MELRPFALDDALLIFERDSGVNVSLDGKKTAALRLLAPRTV